jgi:hypothetical protein
MWEPFQRYKALDPEARKIFRLAAVLLPLVGASLRLRGYKKTQEWLQARWERRNPALPQSASSREIVEKSCRMVRAAVHYGIPGASCLEASLTLWYLLRLQGISASVRIGVRKHTNLFEAHAWVEHEGAALNQLEEGHRHFAPFDSTFHGPPKEEP